MRHFTQDAIRNNFKKQIFIFLTLTTSIRIKEKPLIMHKDKNQTKCHFLFVLNVSKFGTFLRLFKCLSLLNFISPIRLIFTNIRFIIHKKLKGNRKHSCLLPSISYKKKQSPQFCTKANVQCKSVLCRMLCVCLFIRIHTHIELIIVNQICKKTYMTGF